MKLSQLFFNVKEFKLSYIKLLFKFVYLFCQIVNSLKQKLHAVERTVKDKEAELR